MHHEPMHFIYETKILHSESFIGKRWLEIGSGNCFPKAKSHSKDCEWVGVDIEKGDGVDVVSLGHLYRNKKKFDAVCAFEVFEHDPYFDLTVTNMIEHLKPGGLFMMTCAYLGRLEHGTSRSHPVAMPFTQEMDRWKDFYRNRTPGDFRSIPMFKELINGYWVINEFSKDLYYRGWKRKNK